MIKRRFEDALILVGILLNYHINYMFTENNLTSNSILFSNVVSHLITLAILLVMITLYDQRITEYRNKIGIDIALDHDGIQEINTLLNLETHIMHEDEDIGRFIGYHKETSVAKYARLELAFKRYQDQLYQDQLKDDELAIPRSIQEYLKLSTLPNLPYIDHREQVGLFAIKPIPTKTIFYWDSDIGIAKTDERDLLQSDVVMNRRTLTTIEGFDFFQGGSKTQRSGPAVLANFFWCHTHSTGIAENKHILMLPNFLGSPNSIYITTKNKDKKLCSALMIVGEIQEGDQLLMFTGSEDNLVAIKYRLSISFLIKVLTPAILIIPFLKLYLHFGVYYRLLTE